MYHLNFMWCFMMNFPQFHSWGKTQYPQIGHILCNTDHREVQRRTLTSRILGSLHILSKIPDKAQVTSQSFLQRIIIRHSRRHSPKYMYRKFRPVREHLSLKWTSIQLPSEFKKYQMKGNFVLLNDNLTSPVGCHLARGISD